MQTRDDKAVTVFESYLGEVREQVWRVIRQCLDSYQAEDRQLLHATGQRAYYDLLEEHWRIVCDYPERRGKYLRPALVLLMAEAMRTAPGGVKGKPLYTAAAMQVSEDWILIHDDLCDGSMERRGRPALHRLVDWQIAVNAGDTLHECMHRILAENYQALPLAMAQRVSSEFFRMLSRTTFGQFAEIKWTLEDKADMTEQDVLFTMGGKTVYYTIAGPLRLGAILGCASDSELQKIYHFSEPLGLCFQIRDDILDLTSDFEGQKKQTCNDIYEGKRTLMLLHLLRNATAAEQRTIHDILRKPRQEKTPDEVAFIRQLMDSYGSIDYARQQAADYAAEALRRIDGLDFINHQYLDLFHSMVQFILQRGR